MSGNGTARRPRFRPYPRITNVLSAACVFALASPAFADAPNYQLGVTQAVFLTVRDPFNTPFAADFALTSPKGLTRHARIASNKAGEATAQFGGPATNGAFGIPEVNYNITVTGTWHWTCTVKGRSIARGSFAVQFDGKTGHEMIATSKAVF